MTTIRLWVIGLIISAFVNIAEGQRPNPLQPVADESLYISNIRQITNTNMGFFNAGEAYFSPNGGRIIFQATPLERDRYQIYTLDLKTDQYRMVSTNRGACTCAFFHPGGKKIIFASSHLDPDADKPKKSNDSDGYKWAFNKYMDIFEADLDGSNLRRLTKSPGYDAECSYSPNGQHIVFTSQRDDDLEIYVMDANGSNQRRITYGSGYDGGPFFSPDGKSILYRGDRRGDGKMNLQLRIVDITGSHDRAVTDNPIFNWCPYWYPDGKSLIFTQVDHEGWSKGQRPNYDLYMTTIQGKQSIRITYHPAFDGLPVFNRSGTKIMWTSKRGGLDEPQIFIADFKLPDIFNP